MSTTHVRAERLVLAVIVANTGVLAWSLCDSSHEELLETVHTAFLLFFVAEILVRLAASRFNPHQFLTNKWNVFDTTVIGLSLLPLLGVDMTLLRVARLARVVHSLRHTSHLRLAYLAKFRHHHTQETPA